MSILSLMSGILSWYLKKIMAARGPRKDLCVVVVTTSQCSMALPEAPMSRDPGESGEIRFVQGCPRVSLDLTNKLKPAERFQRSCVCQGKLLEMHRSHGWILPLQAIEHRNAHLNGGKIYLDAEDMRPGVALRPGDLVVFFLYVDSRGLGAEDCFPVRNAAAQRKRVARSRNSRACGAVAPRP